MASNVRILVIAGVLFQGGVLAAFADREAHLKIGDPSRAGKVTLASLNSSEGWLDYCTVDIPEPCDAREKARLISVHCREFTIDWNGDDRLRIGNLKDNVVWMAFYPGDTEEGTPLKPDELGIKIETTEEKEGKIEFKSPRFDPFDHLGRPALFTAGIVTDVGELTVHVSSPELNFQTDGPMICQALFQRLAPSAPQYGAQVNYAGDRLEIYFDPAYTLQQAAVTFGSTSPTPGCSGWFRVPRPTGLTGDLNCDGNVDFGDINPFVLALTNPAGYEAAFPNCDIMNGDINGDGRVDFGDINPFVALLTRAGLEGNRPSAPAAQAPPVGG